MKASYLIRLMLLLVIPLMTIECSHNASPVEPVFNLGVTNQTRNSDCFGGVYPTPFSIIPDDNPLLYIPLDKFRGSIFNIVFDGEVIGTDCRSIFYYQVGPLADGEHQIAVYSDNGRMDCWSFYTQIAVIFPEAFIRGSDAEGVDLIYLDMPERPVPNPETGMFFMLFDEAGGQGPEIVGVIYHPHFATITLTLDAPLGSQPYSLTVECLGNTYTLIEESFYPVIHPEHTGDSIDGERMYERKGQGSLDDIEGESGGSVNWAATGLPFWEPWQETEYSRWYFELICNNNGDYIRTYEWYHEIMQEDHTFFNPDYSQQDIIWIPYAGWDPTEDILMDRWNCEDCVCLQRRLELAPWNWPGTEPYEYHRFEMNQQLGLKTEWETKVWYAEYDELLDEWYYPGDSMAVPPTGWNAGPLEIELDDFPVDESHPEFVYTGIATTQELIEDGWLMNFIVTNLSGENLPSPLQENDTFGYGPNGPIIIDWGEENNYANTRWIVAVTKDEDGALLDPLWYFSADLDWWWNHNYPNDSGLTSEERAMYILNRIYVDGECIKDVYDDLSDAEKARTWDWSMRTYYAWVDLDPSVICEPEYLGPWYPEEINGFVEHDKQRKWEMYIYIIPVHMFNCESDLPLPIGSDDKKVIPYYLIAQNWVRLWKRERIDVPSFYDVWDLALSDEGFNHKYEYLSDGFDDDKPCSIERAFIHERENIPGFDNGSAIFYPVAQVRYLGTMPDALPIHLIVPEDVSPLDNGCISYLYPMNELSITLFQTNPLYTEYFQERESDDYCWHYYTRTAHECNVIWKDEGIVYAKPIYVTDDAETVSAQYPGFEGGEYFEHSEGISPRLYVSSSDHKIDEWNLPSHYKMDSAFLISEDDPPGGVGFNLVVKPTNYGSHCSGGVPKEQLNSPGNTVWYNYASIGNFSTLGPGFVFSGGIAKLYFTCGPNMVLVPVHSEADLMMIFGHALEWPDENDVTDIMFGGSLAFFKDTPFPHLDGLDLEAKASLQWFSPREFLDKDFNPWTMVSDDLPLDPPWAFWNRGASGDMKWLFMASCGTLSNVNKPNIANAATARKVWHDKIVNDYILSICGYAEETPAHFTGVASTKHLTIQHVISHYTDYLNIYVSNYGYDDSEGQLVSMVPHLYLNINNDMPEDRSIAAFMETIAHFVNDETHKKLAKADSLDSARAINDSSCWYLTGEFAPARGDKENDMQYKIVCDTVFAAP